ncbi:hypothetical protein AB4Z45_08650 [Paenibacillus sp. MCAF9]|uniref:hypothetical protein n=1 Tax=Paenibacillus sp. MCAF9 TaxID=3233046 RepID=UPI003F944523
MANRYTNLQGNQRISDTYNEINEGFDGVQGDLDAHTGANTAHGATSAATASRIMQRDPAGRAKVAAPAASDDIARKAEVDAAVSTAAADATGKVNTVQNNLTTHSNNVAIHTTQVEKDKLAGIAAGAEVNQNAFSKVAVAGQSDVDADSKTDTLTIAGGIGITVTTNPTTDTVIITATGTAAPGAHASTHVTGGSDVIPNAVAGGNSGLMSGADKAALNQTVQGLADLNAYLNFMPIDGGDFQGSQGGPPFDAGQF